MSWRSPGSFRPNRDVLDQETATELDAQLLRFRTVARRLYVAEALFVNPEIVWIAIDSAKRNTAREFELQTSNSWPVALTIRQIRESSLGGPKRVMIPMTLNTMWATYAKDSAIVLAGVPGGVSALSVESEVGRKLLNARSRDSVRAVLFLWREQLRDSLRTIDQSVRQVLSREGRLDWSHYLYFAFTISTTLGTSDVVPSNALARVLVAIHSVLSVFFFGYALQLFWPAPNGR